MVEAIYVLTKRAMPGLVKIGRTSTTIEQRMRGLDNTSVPLPFECFSAWEVPDSLIAEKALHVAFGDHRIRESREFFRISPDKPTAILRAFGMRDVTLTSDVVSEPDDERALEKARARRPRFSFAMIDVPIGAILHSVFNNDETFIVAAGDKVVFREVNQSLSQSALTIAHETGRSWKTLAGPDYWKFEDETLTDLRNAAESDED